MDKHSLNTKQAESVQGAIQRIQYRSENTGFSVLKVETADSSQAMIGREITVIGTISDDISVGSSILATGAWTEHPKFGRQFKAVSVLQKEPRTKTAIVRYLSSGMVKGFGPKLAERIVEQFGLETLRVIDDEPDRLKEVSGIGRKKLLQIKEHWLERKNVREVMLFLQEHQIPSALSQRIYKKYADKSISIIKNNPYLLAKDLWGVGFQTADRIASSLGIAQDSDLRINAGAIYVLRRAADEGHCYLELQELITKTASLLMLEDYQKIEQAIGQLFSEAELIEEAGLVFLPRLHWSEQRLAEIITERLLDKSTIAELPRVVLQQADQKLKREGFELSEEQRQAVGIAIRSRLSIITGGPGCGKTTVLRTIADIFNRGGLKLKLAAPTGRAAQRLAEVCGLEASTIHRLLRFDPISGAFLHDEQDQLPCDALIVDECSMIDLPLATSLLRALNKDTHLVLVGDVDQLPSVGPGLVLADLLAVEAVPRVRLTKLFRRATESAITQAAYQINASQVPHIPEPDGQVRSDAYYIPISDPESGASLIEELVVNKIPNTYGFETHQITVLTPMNQGALGTIALNKRLQTKVVPKLLGTPELQVGELTFRLGDRVCQRVNNYQLAETGVFNGDQGQVVGIDTEKRELTVELWDGRVVRYPSEYLTQLDLAYALTIHRSQGSEIPVVVLAIHDAHTILLERQLLYTAVTRAKKLLIIVGTKKAISLAVRKARSKNRNTKLRSRIELNLKDKQE